MFSFILRKMLSSKWMIISLLIGNILLCAMASGIPFYSEAVLQRTLVKNMEERQETTGRYPGAVELAFSNVGYNVYGVEKAEEYESMLDTMLDEFGLPVVYRTRVRNLTASRAVSAARGGEPEDAPSVTVRAMENVQEHIKITAGEMFSGQLDSDGAVETVVTQRTLIEQDLMLGETYTLNKLSYSDGTPVTVKVVGVFENAADEDAYWLYSPSTAYSDILLCDYQLWNSRFAGGSGSFYFGAAVHAVVDYTEIRAGDAQRLCACAESWMESWNAISRSACRLNFLTTLQEYPEQAKRLGITLWVLQTPIFILLGFFIFMVSKQILEQEKNSVAVLKSRGAGRRQIILIFLGQSLLVSAASYMIGVPSGALLCGVLGASDGFLGLGARTALDVRPVAEAFIYPLAAALLSVGTMILPVVSYSRVTIVDHKRGVRKTVRPLWQRFFLDVLLLAVGLYGLYSWNNQRQFVVETQGAALDPLLFLCSSLFMIGAGLLYIRLFHVPLKMVWRLGEKRWSPPLYAAFLKVTRSSGEEQMIMLFLVLTIAVGIFNAKTARTINTGVEDAISYGAGADITLMEQWQDNSYDDSATMLVYKEPDVGRYAALDADLTKVQITKNLSSGGAENLTVMGVDTRQFGEISWMRDGLLPTHYYNYLNAMASDPRAVLATMNFHDILGYELGDSVSVANVNGAYFTGRICGFVDYWPTYIPTSTVTNYSGVTKVEDNYLLVANLSQLQSAWGVMPYELWFSAEDSGFIYDFAERNELLFERFTDRSVLLEEARQDPVLQGTNGLLTVGFITILLVCMTGFLIYWILSIRSRELQFGIFRAMGMSMRDILKMLLAEQVMISGVTILIGALIGCVASELYVPLIQLGYASEQNVLPVSVMAQTGDYWRLFTTVGLTMLLCIAVLGGIIKRIKIAQALKLGED